MLREFKGKSLIALPDTYVVIDTETTGLDYEFCDIIEISAIKVVAGEVVDSFSSLVQPPPSFTENPETGVEECTYVDEYITALTGITNASLENAPKIDSVFPAFANFIGNNILIGHNVNFDINFLYDAGARLGYQFSNSFIDTMRIARKIYPDLKHHRLCDIASHLNIIVTNAHRALADCETTNECYTIMRRSFLDSMSEDAFKALYKPHHRNNGSKIDIASIVSENTVFDETNPLYGKTVVFTGALHSMLRKDTMQCVVNVGGINANSVTKSTNFLVIGSEEFASSVKDGKTTKMKKAESLRLKGNDIQIISEDAFFDMLAFEN